MISANISNQTRNFVYRRDNFKCALCDDTRGLQVHHAIPRGQGGNDALHNLITLCWRCHCVAHGTKIADYPEHITPEWIEQSCIEYLSDYYAERGYLWNGCEPLKIIAPP